MDGMQKVPQQGGKLKSAIASMTQQKDVSRNLTLATLVKFYFAALQSRFDPMLSCIEATVPLFMMASKTKSRKLKPLDSNVILGAISPANQYLVRLIEDKKELSFKKPTLERMNLVFQVLEDLLPHMGIFTRVLKLIRDELY
ncbi:hypothetical protein scyTo_0015899, partial [Scyliorhinus torazame]|nr:hypothetical protein [Scyliorhinus torazame]